MTLRGVRGRDRRSRSPIRHPRMQARCHYTVGMTEKAAAPRIACLPNGPYYLLNDPQALPVPNLVRSSGAAVEEIIATIRKCPSGALSYAIDGEEAAPPARPPQVLVTDNGPYAVSGGIELMGVQFGDGASREHYTLCRCGASANKPFCDGSHWRVEFRDP